MVKGLETKTIIWNWLETIEPPSVVQILCAPMVNDNNFYSQVTVKMHSKQVKVLPLFCRNETYNIWAATFYIIMKTWLFK